jgi:uncharacterized protein YceK
VKKYVRLAIAFYSCLLLCSCGSIIAVGNRVYPDKDEGCPFYQQARTELQQILNRTPDSIIDAHEFWPLLVVDLPITALTETVLLPVDAIQWTTIR